MAQFDGFISEASHGLDRNANMSAAFEAFARDTYTPRTFDSAPHLIDNTLSRPRKSTAKKAVASRVITDAYHGRSYLDDYYFRIHVIPPVIDVGNLLQQSVRVFHLWNAYFDAKQITAIAETDADGLILNSPTGLPYDFLPISILEYSVTAGIDGPAIIDATYTWTIEGEFPELSVIGRRAVVFPFLPDWSEPVQERLQWLTELLIAEDGLDYAQSLRADPRRGMAYSLWEQKEAAQQIDSLLWGWQHQYFAVPVPMDQVGTTAQVLPGQFVVSLDPQYRNFRDGGDALIYQDENNFEVVQIETVNAGDLTLAAQTLNSWPQGVDVYPLMFARLPNGVRTERITDQLVRMQPEWSAAPQNDDPNLPVAAAPLTYKTYELYLDRPNWVERPEIIYDRDYDITDFATGAEDLHEEHDFPFLNRTCEWLLEGRPAINAFREMLARRKGALAPLWAPDWMASFTLVEDIINLSTGISLAPNEYEKFSLGHSARNHLIVLLNDGTYYTREILDSVVAAGVQTITVDTAFDRDIAIAEVERVTFLGFWRMDDSVELAWHSNETVVARTNLRLIKHS